MASSRSSAQSPIRFRQRVGDVGRFFQGFQALEPLADAPAPAAGLGLGQPGVIQPALGLLFRLERPVAVVQRLLPRLLGSLTLLSLRGLGTTGPDRLPGADQGAQHQGRDDDHRRRQRRLVPAGELSAWAFSSRATRWRNSGSSPQASSSSASHRAAGYSAIARKICRILSKSVFMAWNPVFEG